MTLPDRTDLPVSRGWAVFTVTGVSMDRITADLAMQPDRIVGQEFGPENSVWQLHSRLSGAHSLGEHFQDLLDRLYPGRRRLRHLSRSARATFHVTLVESRGVPLRFVLPPRMTLLAGYLGAEVEFEVERVEFPKEYTAEEALTFFSKTQEAS